MVLLEISNFGVKIMSKIITILFFLALLSACINEKPSLSNTNDIELEEITYEVDIEKEENTIEEELEVRLSEEELVMEWHNEAITNLRNREYGKVVITLSGHDDEISNDLRFIARAYMSLNEPMNVDGVKKSLGRVKNEHNLQVIINHITYIQSKLPKVKLGAIIGMTKEQVLNSTWGEPISKNITTTTHGTREQWVYGNGNYLYFKDNILESIQTKKSN